MDFRHYWLEMLLGLSVALALIAWSISIIWPFIAIAGLCYAAFKGVPAGWGVFKALSSFVDDKAMQKEQLLLMSAVRERILLGDDTQYKNSINGIEFKLNVPKRMVEVEEVEEEEEPLLIEASADECLNISTDYHPHADEFLSARKLVVGVSGSGKSNSTATICEELGRLKVPMILADTENEYESLCDKRYLPHGMLVDASKINCDNAARFGAYVLENNIQAILNLQSYEMDEGACVMIAIIQGLNEWQEARSNELRIPIEFLLEEATSWLPQNVKESPLNDTEVMPKLQSAFFNDLVRKGRKRGLGLTVICQKIAEIDKRALQCDVKILHRQTELNDLAKYAKMGISNEETLSLQNGEGYYFSSRVSKKLIQMRKRYSSHGANTPGLHALRKHQKSSLSFPLSSGGGNDFALVETSMETAPRADLEPLLVVPQTDDEPSVESRQIYVSDEKRETIKRLIDMNIPNRDVARAVGLSGRKYQIYQQVCREEGLLPHDA